MCVCTCVYVRVLCVLVCMCARVCMYVCAYTCVYTFTCVYIRVYICVCDVYVFIQKKRVGGRTHSVMMDNTLFDVGGMWVGNSQHVLRGVMKKLGLTIYPQYNEVCS